MPNLELVTVVEKTSSSVSVLETDPPDIVVVVETIDDVAGDAQIVVLDANSLVIQELSVATVNVVEGGFVTSGVTVAPQRVYVQDDEPDAYLLWVQTGLGDTGDDWTFWFEDGV